MLLTSVHIGRVILEDVSPGVDFLIFNHLGEPFVPNDLSQHFVNIIGDLDGAIESNEFELLELVGELLELKIHDFFIGCVSMETQYFLFIQHIYFNTMTTFISHRKIALVYLLQLIYFSFGFDPNEIAEDQESAPVIVIQQEEFYHYEVESLFPNATYEYTGESYPNCSQLSINSTSFIQLSANKTLDYSICPIFEWTPLYQPVHFYLSPKQISLVIYKSYSEIEVEQKSFQVDLDTVTDNITCFSILPIDNQTEFAVDCNLQNITTNITVKAFLFYAIFTDNDTQVISSFEFKSYQTYEYINQTIDSFVNQCPLRQTLPLDIVTYDVQSFFQQTYIQYCPQNSTYFLIISSKSINDQQPGVDLYLTATYGDYNNLSNTNQVTNLNVDLIFTNQLIAGYNDESWNVGFLFVNISKVFKCQFTIFIFDSPLWNCSHIYMASISLKQIDFQPTYRKVVQSFNQELYLLIANQAALYTVYLHPNYNNSNVQGVIYQEIWQVNYYLLDIQLANDYIAVLMTNDSNIESHKQPPEYYCLYNYSQSQYKVTSLLKIYEKGKTRLPVYEINIQKKTIFLSELYFSALGSYINFYQSDNNKSIISIYKLQVQQLIINYDSTSPGFFCDSYSIVPYFPIVANISVLVNLRGESQIQMSKYLVICLASSQYQLPQLVAKNFIFNKSNISFPLTQCPTSNDEKIFTLMTNNMNLFDGLMGPLLQFSYAPDPKKSVYYPAYLDYLYTIKFSESSNFSSVYLVYEAITEQILQSSNIFGVVSMLLSHQDQMNQIDYVKCNIVEKQENRNQQDVFKISIELDECERKTYQQVDDLSVIDFFKRFRNYEIAIQYYPPIFMVCEVSSKQCQQITIDITYQIQQLDCRLDQQLGSQLYYIITILPTESPTVIFYSLELDMSLQLQAQTLTAMQYDQFQVDSSQIVQFHYILFQQQYSLATLLYNSTFLINVASPVAVIQPPVMKSYTVVSSSKDISYCSSLGTFMSFGFNVANIGQFYNQGRSINIWCSNSTNSYIFQFLINEVNNLQFWRLIPLYGYQLSYYYNVFVSGLSLYVPIHGPSDKIQTYLIYNLIDQSPRMLIGTFDVKVFTKNERSIITCAIKSMNELTSKLNQISLTLVIGEEQFIYYINQDAKFIFNLVKEYYKQSGNNTLDYQLMIQVESNDQIILFRNYSIIYDFTNTEITLNNTSGNCDSDQANQTTLQLSQQDVQTKGGYYIYLLLINQSTFAGPVSNYAVNCESPEATIVASPYIQVEKFLGTYMDTILTYGQISNIISLDDPMYQSLFLAPGNASSYLDIVLVLTSRYLLFYQKQSYKDSSPFNNCSFLNYTNQNDINPNYTDPNSSQPKYLNTTCGIRLIHTLELSLPYFNPLSCLMQINFPYQVMILCQKILNEQSFTVQNFIFVNYTYFPLNNSITVSSITHDLQQLCFCFALDLQPFKYGEQVYLVAKYSYLKVNTYLTIYQVAQVFEKGTNPLMFKLTIPSPGDRPLAYIQDFTLLIINSELQLLLLHDQNILCLQVNLEDMSITNNNQFFRPKNLDSISNLSYFTQKMQFIASVNQTKPNSKGEYIIMYGNQNVIFEIACNFSSYTFEFTYFFKQYQLCQHQFIEKPQFVSFDNQIEYIVSMCLTDAFAYSAIQEEMTYIFGVPPTNQIYLSFFVRLTTQNSSYPVYILEDQLVDPQTLHFTKYQIYLTTNDMGFYSPKMLLTNSTYFLIDYQLYSKYGYYVVYPTHDSTENEHSVSLMVTASNAYSSNTTQYTINFPYSTDNFKSLVWFYAMMLLLGISFLFAVFYIIVNYCKHDAENDRQAERQQLKRPLGASGSGIEMVNQEMVRSQSDDALEVALQTFFENVAQRK